MDGWTHEWTIDELRAERDKLLFQNDTLKREIRLARAAMAEVDEMKRLNCVLKAVVEMVVNNKPLWKIQSAAVDALGEVSRQSHSTCCLSCQQRNDCAICHCHVAKPDKEGQQTEKRVDPAPKPDGCRCPAPCWCQKL